MRPRTKPPPRMSSNPVSPDAALSLPFKVLTPLGPAACNMTRHLARSASWLLSCQDNSWIQGFVHRPTAAGHRGGGFRCRGVRSASTRNSPRNQGSEEKYRNLIQFRLPPNPPPPIALAPIASGGKCLLALSSPFSLAQAIWPGSPPTWPTVAHSSARRKWPRTRARARPSFMTAKLHDRTKERLTQDEVERLRL